MTLSSSPSTAASNPARFAGSIPEHYDRYLGPFLFEPYAKDLATRLTIAANATAVLEIAAGTGIVTEQLRRRVPSEVRLIATDLNAAMIAVARRRVPNSAGVDFREADAQALPFPDAMFDAVVCQFGVMFFPDKPLAAREAKRVLKPGGQWVFNVWGSLAENPGARIAHEVVTSFFTTDPPTFYHTPFGFFDPKDLRALAKNAGFTTVTVTDVQLTVQSPSARDAATGFVQGSPAMNAIIERGVDPEKITNAVAAALASEFGDRPLKTPMVARVVSAIA